MRSPLPVALVLLLAVSGVLAAQDSDAPRRGKIDGVERESDRGDKGSGDGCSCGWLLAIGEDAVQLFVPRGTGRGYLRYPYAHSADDPQTPFMVRSTERGRSFVTVAINYFDDAGATLTGGRVAIEAGAALAYASLEGAVYREPLANETDHLYTWRLGAGVLPRPGRTTMLRLGVATRGLSLDDGSTAGGLELEAGAQLFPVRPFGAGVTGRIAAMQWAGGDAFPLRELNTTGSVFIGRAEIQLGWHWMKIGAAPAFGGPTLGTRVWF